MAYGRQFSSGRFIVSGAVPNGDATPFVYGLMGDFSDLLFGRIALRRTRGIGNGAGRLPNAGFPGRGAESSVDSSVNSVGAGKLLIGNPLRL